MSATTSVRRQPSVERERPSTTKGGKSPYVEKMQLIDTSSQAAQSPKTTRDRSSSPENNNNYASRNALSSSLPPSAPIERKEFNKFRAKLLMSSQSNEKTKLRGVLKTPQKASEMNDSFGNSDGMYQQNITVVKPKEQLQLSEAELQEEVIIVLSANNPTSPDNITIYSLVDQAYKLEPTLNHLAVHFEMEGYYLHVETEEGKKQIQQREEETRRAQVKQSNLASAAAVHGDANNPYSILNYDANIKDDEGTKLRNQFNFSNRAVQTIGRLPRERGTMTEPPPRKSFSANVTQWEIYDAYLEEDKIKKGQGASKAQMSVEVNIHPISPSQPIKIFSTLNNKELENSKSMKSSNLKNSKDIVINDSEWVESETVGKALRMLERMVSQNSTSDITLDYKFWEDPADSYQPNGTLLPLWKFKTDHSKKSKKRKPVTSVCWNPSYKDLFAVGYGFYDFSKMSSTLVPSFIDNTDPNQTLLCGTVACFSLKNPKNPEYSFTTESGVMCLDFHTQHPSLLAVGMYDGTVAVYDLQRSSKQGLTPLIASTVKTHKHMSPVWQVAWTEDDLAKNLNFFSISSDGRVTSWTLVKNEMLYNDVIELKLVQKVTITDDVIPLTQPSIRRKELKEKKIVAPVEVSESEQDSRDTTLYGLAGGCCFDFLKNDHLFIVGTEEGCLHKCSKAYNSSYLLTYEGHTLAVCSVKWNLFHPRMFLSGGFDWCVKLWDHTQRKPILTFELKAPVQDICWAPFSSTIFAVATADGRLHIFDLSKNKHDPLCSQVISKTASPTRMAFNAVNPVLLVGLQNGLTQIFKLSPNLRGGFLTNNNNSMNIEDTTKTLENGTQNNENPYSQVSIEVEREKLERIVAMELKKAK